MEVGGRATQEAKAEHKEDTERAEVWEQLVLFITRKLLKEALIKSKKSINRHSGAGQNPVLTIIYWMLVFTSKTMQTLNHSFLK